MLMNLNDESDLKPDVLEEIGFAREFGASLPSEERLASAELTMPEPFAITDRDASLEGLELSSSSYI